MGGVVPTGKIVPPVKNKLSKVARPVMAPVKPRSQLKVGLSPKEQPTIRRRGIKKPSGKGRSV